jgi:hypothetical protein
MSYIHKMDAPCHFGKLSRFSSRVVIEKEWVRGKVLARGNYRNLWIGRGSIQKPTLARLGFLSAGRY